MSAPVCPKCNAPVPAAEDVRTEWALCPRCGEVLGGAASEPPAPEFRRRAPYDRAGARRRFRRALACAAGAVLLALVTGGTSWWVRAFSPAFAAPTASPLGDFEIAFPGPVQWSDPGDNLISRMYGRDVSASFYRKYGIEGGESFVVNTSTERTFFGPHNESALPAMVLQSVTPLAPRPGAPPPRRVPVPKGLAAEGEFYDDMTGKRTALRFIVVDWRQYYLSVIGPNVGLNDRRVQQFFDSFRYIGPPPEPPPLRDWKLPN